MIIIKVFGRLRQINLKQNTSKCVFLKREFLYFVYVVSEHSILPDPDKVECVKNYPVPKCEDEVSRFVAFVNYYRKFINNLAEIVLPLNHLSKKTVQFKWTAQCQKALESLEDSLINPPILDYPDFFYDNQFQLRTDSFELSL